MYHVYVLSAVVSIMVVMIPPPLLSNSTYSTREFDPRLVPFQSHDIKNGPHPVFAPHIGTL